jgi:hypothetical protein
MKMRDDGKQIEEPAFPGKAAPKVAKRQPPSAARY